MNITRKGHTSVCICVCVCVLARGRRELSISHCPHSIYTGISWCEPENMHLYFLIDTVKITISFETFEWKQHFLQESVPIFAFCLHSFHYFFGQLNHQQYCLQKCAYCQSMLLPFIHRGFEVAFGLFGLLGLFYKNKVIQFQVNYCLCEIY